MKKELIGALGLMAVVSAPALAADLPAKVYQKAPAVTNYDWSGFYAGVNAGGGTQRECWTNSFAGGAPTIPVTSEGCNQTTGALLGGQVGYRWQWTNWVFGVEAQGDWANMSGANASFLLTGPPPTNQVTNQGKVNGLGLFTGQIGYAWNNVLWFVKGGAAVTSDKYQGINTATSVVFDQASDTRWGAAVGTGIEVGFGTNWSVGVEYSHLFMGTSTLNLLGVPGGGLSRTESIQQNADIGLLRVNYRFGGPVVAKF
jgi:outer membrane immunogenic protein